MLYFRSRTRAPTIVIVVVFVSRSRGVRISFSPAKLQEGSGCCGILDIRCHSGVVAAPPGGLRFKTATTRVDRLRVQRIKARIHLPSVAATRFVSDSYPSFVSPFFPSPHIRVNFFARSYILCNRACSTRKSPRRTSLPRRAILN